MYTGHLDFTDPATEVNAIVDEVWAGGADMVIVVAHVGGYAPDYGEAAALANALDPAKVNLLVTGHTHSSIATTINGIPVIQSFNGGSAFGRVDFTVDPWFMNVTSFTVKPTQNVYNTWAGGPAMYEGQPVLKDEAVAAVLQPYFDEVAVLKNTVIGETTVPIIRDYRHESAMGTLVTDAMRAVDPAIDFAMTNSGGLRADLDAGPITFGEMFTVLPFGNTFTKVWLTGEQLLSTLEDGVSGLHGLVQVSGLQFTFDYDLPMHSRIIGDVINLNTGLPIDPAETYLVVVNNFMAAGGDHYGTLPLAPQQDTYIVDIDGVVEYGERPNRNGLFIVNGMGMDTENLTCLAAAGANVLFFSTGRGTPVGFSFVPVIKVTGNRGTFERMRDNMDALVDIASAGSLAASGRQLFQLAVEVAAGRTTSAEILHQSTYNGICVTGP
jgi:5'-nucleotidase